MNGAFVAVLHELPPGWIFYEKRKIFDFRWACELIACMSTRERFGYALVNWRMRAACETCHDSSAI
jgi:hypothetical protein